MDPVDQDLNRKEAEDAAYNARFEAARDRHLDDIAQDVGVTQEFLIESLPHRTELELAHIHGFLSESGDCPELGYFIQSLYDEYVVLLAESRAKQEVI